MENGVVAGVIVKSKFCAATSNVFNGYINYIDRKESKRSEKLSEYNLYNNYMGNPEKTTGLFTKNNIKLNEQEKQDLKEVFKTAQENGSLMWQTVISFDNRWLEEYGLYDSSKNIVDENKLKEIASGAINKMLKNESLENAVWSGAIHYNTDNIHIHVAIVEPLPMRATKERQVYVTKTVAGEEQRIPLIGSNGKPVKAEEYIGRFKGKSIEMCKKFVVDEIIAQKEQNIEINKIIREQIVKQKSDHILSMDADLQGKFLDVYKCLPRTGNRGLWNYNNKAMKAVRPMLDDLTRAYIEKYHKEDYKVFLNMLKKQSTDYKTAYGKNGNRSFEESKIKELYERLGNQIIKEMKSYDVRTGGIEYNSNDVEKIMDSYFDKTQDNEEEYIEETYDVIESEVSIASHMEWNDNFRKARKYLHGKNKDLKNGLNIMLNESQKGNVLAIYEMGNIYHSVMGIIDEKKSYDYFKKALISFEHLLETPVNGNNEAYIQYRIGKHYYYGLGTDKDYDSAFKYLKLSADAGNAHAAYMIGNMFYNNDLIDADKNTAFEYYKKASIGGGIAEKGTAYADYKMAQMYEKGDAIGQDLEEAQHYYSISYDSFYDMEQVNPDGRLEYKLGMMNLKGQGVDTNLEDAEYFLKLSAENGYTYGICQYSKILLDKGERSNSLKAVEMLEHLAKENNASAQYSLGYIYSTDERMKNEEKAIYYFSKASGRVKSAYYQLGKIYSNTDSINYNVGKAIQYLSAGSENIYAKYRLGKIYLDKETQYFNVEKAVEIFTDIAAEGNQFAQYNLGKIYSDKELGVYDPQKAVEYYLLASDQGNQYADVALGFMFYYGDGVNEDKAKAKFYFSKAGEAGNEYAKKMMQRIDNPSTSENRSRLRVRTKNKSAYEMERALNSLKHSFETSFEKERMIRLHEQLLEEERKEKELNWNEREEKEYKDDRQH